MKKYSKVFPVTLLFIVIFLFLQGFNAYHFYYIEQFQLFLTTSSCFFESLSHPGGLMEYFSRFLVQFFIIPYFGAIIEAFILLLIFIVSSRLILRQEKSKIFVIAPGTIFLSCLLMCFNFNIFFQGVLSFLLCIYCLDFFLSSRNSIPRNILVFMAIPLLHWIAGPVSVLFAVCFFLHELFNGKSKKRIGWLLLPAFACLVSWLAVRFSFTGSLRFAFLPDMYFQTKLSPSVVIYIPWLLLLFWIPVATFFPKLNFSRTKSYWVIGIQFLLFLLLFWQGVVKFGDRASYEVKKLDYYDRNEQWDKIITESGGKEINNYLHLNYLNLALAEKGELLERMFQFRQEGPLSLEVSSQKKNIISALMSDISFSIGDIASSQRYAFEGYETSTGGGSGRLLKRLVQTNLIYGEYAVAEKYIGILEHTLLYRKWATAQRQFLYNDSLCMENPLLAEKRKCLLPRGSRKYVTGLPETLKTLIDASPSNQTARDYFFAYLLLSKELNLFSGFFSQYEQKGMFPGKLPTSIQQALLVLNESQPEKWKEKGISEGVSSQYRVYKSIYTRNHRNPGKKEIMQKQFASTYWFYFQFITVEK